MVLSKPTAIKTVTLGCKVNQFESDAVTAALKNRGWVPASGTDAADVCLINTCTVTAKAAMQSRQAIRKAVRCHPDAWIVVSGCHAQMDPDEIAAIPGVHAVVGHADAPMLPDLICRLLSSRRNSGPLVLRRTMASVTAFHCPGEGVVGERTRAFLKIQDGCNTFCTYCIVPHARGRSRSMPLDQVFSNLRLIAAKNVREVVLTGIHLGAYGLDLSPPSRLIDLLAEIEALDCGLRIRLSSIEPTELTDRLIQHAARSRCICPHFHIPLQSGDDRILARMHRPYTAGQFAERVQSVHRALPNAGVGADILVGFPGEDDRAFENTCELIHALSLSYLHVFPFSPRRGTPAYHMPDKVPPETIKSRCKILNRINKEIKLIFYNRYIDKKLEVLIESHPRKSTGLLMGMSDNYIPVILPTDSSRKNQIVPVSVRRIDNRQRVFAIPA